MTKAKITIDGVAKSYKYKDSFVRALEPSTLEVSEGEFVCILGPSGCGKSTLLRMVAGLVEPSEGRLLMDGIPIRGPAPERGLVFQEYALFPWMSVKKNVMYGPMVRGLGRNRATTIAADYIGRVGLNGFEEHFPRQLSGGMKQRIGIARVLANDPDVLLMDEPFGALDSITRGIMQRDLLTLWNQERKTVLFVTHSVEEASRIATADYVITNKVPLGQAQLEAVPRLKLIAIAATGYDVVDVRACAAKNVEVVNIRNYAVNTVPEHTFALILGLRRSILAYRDSIRAGRWQAAAQFCYFDYPVNDLAHSTLGIIGDGALGKTVGDLGRAFGMKVLFSTYKDTEGMGPLYTPFEEVMATSDVITLHAPLLPSTRHMISDAEFALMERRPLIINTARGGLVDEEALARALRSGRIAGAGFDVVTSEPPPRNHVFMELLELPNFILTPHVAWSSREAIQGLADQLVQNIERFNSGNPRHLISA